MSPGPIHPGHQSAPTEILATQQGPATSQPAASQSADSAPPLVQQTAGGTATGATGRGSRHRWVLVAAAGLALMVLIRGFVVASYYIPSTSMEPTLEPGDRIVVTKIGVSALLERGDLVVFDGTRNFAQRSAGTGSDQQSGLARALGAIGSILVSNESDYVKRVVGLPGDHVVCCDRTGLVVVNGVPVKEPYLFPGDRPSDLTFDVTVPAERIWVLGDHRSDSADSRAHLGDPGGGMVRLDDVIGRAGLIYWPPSRAGLLSAPDPLVGIPENTSGEGHT